MIFINYWCKLREKSLISAKCLPFYYNMIDLAHFKQVGYWLYANIYWMTEILTEFIYFNLKKYNPNYFPFKKRISFKIQIYKFFTQIFLLIRFN